MDDLDAYHAVHLLVQHQSRMALCLACLQMLAFEAQGDLAGARMWKRTMTTIRTLRQMNREASEALQCAARQTG